MRRLLTLILSILSASLYAGEPLPEGALLRLGTTNLRGCWGTFAFTPDGKHIAVVHGEKSDRVTIHDCTTGKPIRTVATGGIVRSLSFSPDGKRLLAPRDGDFDTPVWDVQTGREVGRVAGSSARFADQGRKIVTHQPRMLRDGKRVIGVFDGSNYRWLGNKELPDRSSFSHLLSPTHSARRLDNAWEIATHPEGKVVFTAPWAENAREGRFHDDGKLFVFGDRAGIHVWGVKTGRKIRTIEARTDSVVDVSGDGKRLGWAGYDEKEGIAFAWVCDLAGGTPRHVGPATNSFQPVHFSPDGRRLAILMESHALVLRDVRTGKDVFPSAGHTGWVGKVRFTPDGRHIVSRDRHAILVWERGTGRLLRRLPDDLPGGELPIVGTLAADFVITVAPDGTLRKRDLVTGRELRVLAGKHGFVFGAAEPASVSQDGKVLAVVSRDYNIRAYDLASGKILLDFDPPCAIWSVFLSPRGQALAWTSQNHPKGDRVRYLDVSSGREVERAELPASALPLDREVGRWLPPEDLLPRLHDLGLVNKEGRVLLDRWIDKPHQIRLTTDGRYVLASRLIRRDDFVDEGPREINLAIWEIATGRRLPPLISDRQFTEVASFSPDGRLVVTTSLQGSIHVWELATGKERVVLQGHLSDSVYAIAFSPDGRYLLSGGNDTQVFLWDFGAGTGTG
jgi:WD40 repeat protein